MKRLVLILFMLPMLAFGQHHMMSVLASQSDWDYVGVMTVGSMAGYYGWDDDFVNIGSINPSSPQVAGYNVTISIIWHNGELNIFDSGYEKSCDTVEINGVELTGFDQYGILSVESNPFPAAGQNCTIKLK